MKNDSSKTQDFFSEVVTAKKGMPKKPYTPIVNFTQSEKDFAQIYNGFIGNFDQHIFCSIPTFYDIQIVKGIAIAKTLTAIGGEMIDIGGSEGTLCKAISLFADVQTLNLEPNKDMLQSNKAKGQTVINEAFYSGFDNIPAHKPEKKYSIVHESMCFQFITPERAQFIEHIKEDYLTNDGIAIFEEKFTGQMYMDNERQKDLLHKSLYFEKADITAKKESILTGMSENQANKADFIKLLCSKFEYVFEYWTSGNFAGYACSDSSKSIATFYRNINIFNSMFGAPQRLIF